MEANERKEPQPVFFHGHFAIGAYHFVASNLHLLLTPGLFTDPMIGQSPSLLSSTGYPLPWGEL